MKRNITRKCKKEGREKRERKGRERRGREGKKWLLSGKNMRELDQARVLVGSGAPGVCEPSDQWRVGSPDSPWKQSRYSSRCPAPFTCTIETGKLLEEEANTAGAKEWSFLSRNSVKSGEKRGFRNELVLVARLEQSAGWGEDLGPTLKRVLLHVNFVEFIGSNKDTVIGEVDAAAGL